MKRTSPVFRPSVGITVFLLCSVLFFSCGGSNNRSDKSDTTREVLGPAPDNNSANNPSSADTMYQRDSGRGKTTDTLHH